MFASLATLARSLRSLALNNIYIYRDSRSNRPESVSLASLARQLHTLYYTLHTEHAYCLGYRFFNNVVTTTVIEMVEMVEVLDEDLVSFQLSK